MATLRKIREIYRRVRRKYNPQSHQYEPIPGETSPSANQTFSSTSPSTSGSFVTAREDISPQSLLSIHQVDSLSSTLSSSSDPLIPRIRSSNMDKHFFNILILGFSFLLLFTAFQTGGMIQETVVKGVNQEYAKQWNGHSWSGYTSLSIVYLVFSIANWIAPSIVAIFGPKTSMIMAAVIYCLYIGSFLYPLWWTLSAASAVLGLGAAVIWTAQGNLLTLNSNQSTIGRNSGVFWALFQGSLIFGNIFVSFQFKGIDIIDEKTRQTTYSGLLGAGIAGTILMFMLRSYPASETNEKPVGPVQALYDSFTLFRTKAMVLMFFTFAYTGIAQSFITGVYVNSIGFTKAIGENRKTFVGVAGCLIGIGETIGGGIFGIFGKKTAKLGRDPIVFFGLILHIAAYAGVFINLPFNANLGDTDESSIIPTSLPLALVCSFLLGLGDACMNTQIYSQIGSFYESNSAPAFAIFKFVQSLFSSLFFFFTSEITLNIQIYIMVGTAILGSITFFIVEQAARRKSRSADITPSIAGDDVKDGITNPAYVKDTIGQSTTTLVVP
ncbi:UNC93-like protein MFSD11 [Tetranychus urticae]|uniref:UNC93-like protein MFSD11 n=1 Tax=Tetranychus urticae TaxID=32264 RepID=T1KMP6_TETUR|nr:UNC93-like protein MFSD11 [Tetranychus urticae]